VSWLKSGELQSRLIGAHMSINLQDGSGGEMGVDPTTENLIVPFEINRRRGIIIPSAATTSTTGTPRGAPMPRRHSR
jgi:hypothetical protein